MKTKLEYSMEVNRIRFILEKGIEKFKAKEINRYKYPHHSLINNLNEYSLSKIVPICSDEFRLQPSDPISVTSVLFGFPKQFFHKKYHFICSLVPILESNRLIVLYKKIIGNIRYLDEKLKIELKFETVDKVKSINKKHLPFDILSNESFMSDTVFCDTHIFRLYYGQKVSSFNNNYVDNFLFKFDDEKKNVLRKLYLKLLSMTNSLRTIHRNTMCILFMYNISYDLLFYFSNVNLGKCLTHLSKLIIIRSQNKIIMNPNLKVCILDLEYSQHEKKVREWSIIDLRALILFEGDDQDAMKTKSNEYDVILCNDPTLEYQLLNDHVFSDNLSTTLVFPTLKMDLSTGIPKGITCIKFLMKNKGHKSVNYKLHNSTKDVVEILEDLNSYFGSNLVIRSKLIVE